MQNLIWCITQTLNSSDDLLEVKGQAIDLG